jgi:glyoxylase I family protein
MAIIKEINHVALRTPDLEATRRFYIDVLGGKIIRNLKNAEGVSYTYYFQLAEGVIEVFGGKENLGYQHIAFLTADDRELYALCDEMKTMGYVFHDGPRKAASGIGDLAFFKDSSGVVFELIQRKEDIRIPGLKNEQIEEFACVSICVPEEKTEKCDAFYRDTLGLKKKGAAAGKAWYSYGPDTIEAVTGSSEKPLSHIV